MSREMCSYSSEQPEIIDPLIGIYPDGRPGFREPDYSAPFSPSKRKRTIRSKHHINGYFVHYGMNKQGLPFFGTDAPVESLLIQGMSTSSVMKAIYRLPRGPWKAKYGTWEFTMRDGTKVTASGHGEIDAIRNAGYEIFETQSAIKQETK